MVHNFILDQTNQVVFKQADAFVWNELFELYIEQGYAKTTQIVDICIFQILGAYFQTGLDNSALRLVASRVFNVRFMHAVAF